MAVFTDSELEYLAGQRLARLATASAEGQPDVSAVGFSVDGDTVVSSGLELTKTAICAPTRGRRSLSTTWPASIPGGLAA